VADSKVDRAVWRSGPGVWYVLKSSDGTFRAVAFGSAGEGHQPVPHAYIR
jgi:hypothetical protein